MIRVLALLDDRAGNNSQVLGVAQRLGFSFETRQVRSNPLIHIPYGIFQGGVSLDAPVTAPWPDVIIFCRPPGFARGSESWAMHSARE